MRRTLAILLTAGFGVGLLGLGLLVGLVSSPTAAEQVPGWLAALVVLLVGALAAWKLLRSPSDDGVAPAPWTESGSLVATPPEETPDTDRISGTAFTEHIERAAREARREETVDAGLAAAREPLRELLVGALEQGGWDETRIDDALASGSWTDDPVAAAVVDERVSPPVRSLRRRVWAWLFPERAVRHRIARTVGAVATISERVLPPVVGQHAPRPVPIVEPTVADLKRAADGTLRRAVEGQAAVRAPEEDDGSERDAAPEADDTGEPDTDSEASANREPDRPTTAESADDSGWDTVEGDD